MARRYSTATTAPEALTGLLAARVDADPDVGEVTVLWGMPGEDVPTDVVWVGGVEPVDQDAAALGQRRRDERYRIPVFVDVVVPGADPAAANRRAGTLARLVEEVVGDAPTLDGALYDDGSAEVGGIEAVIETQQANERSCIAVWRVWVACRARV